MVSDVSLAYDSSFLGKGVFHCDPFSVNIYNATVQDIMNAGANYAIKGGSCHGESGGDVPIPYTADYVTNFGNILKYVFSSLRIPIPQKIYNISNERWQLYINNKQIGTSMSTTFVQSGDHIKWVFEKKGSF